MAIFLIIVSLCAASVTLDPKLFLPLTVVFVWAKKSPPCAKGGQHGRAMQGGLCHFAWLHDRVRKHRLGAVSRSLNPSVGVRRQLPLHKGGPVAGRPYCFCRIAPNQPPLWHWARIAKRPLPGDGLSHPEHRGIEEHKAFSEFWVRRHSAGR